MQKEKKRKKKKRFWETNFLAGISHQGSPYLLFPERSLPYKNSRLPGVAYQWEIIACSHISSLVAKRIFGFPLVIIRISRHELSLEYERHNVRQCVYTGKPVRLLYGVEDGNGGQYSMNNSHDSGSEYSQRSSMQFTLWSHPAHQVHKSWCQRLINDMTNCIVLSGLVNSVWIWRRWEK